MIKNKLFSSFIVFLLLFVFNSAKAVDSTINISPIVQIISYYDVYWKYPMMMWWWSASIITNDWVIISNDHVVDDGKWALASAFSVCITKEISKKPVCDYTASLITRDDKLDISILKIDPLDIYGNKVDYTKFKTIDIDYNYEPKNQDETIAIGYPWIWADTISETKWIVSWISEYNWYKYIKTDTLIAGGNSGWAFVRDWKLIGIPTFWIGWWDSMWYALSIKEAESFIEENKWKISTKNPITNLIDFNYYRKNIENINTSHTLKDDIFEVNLPLDYQVSNYIKNTTLNIELKKQKDTWVNYLSFYIEKGPELSTEKKKLYYFEKSWFYNKDWQKLLKKNISWIDFYYPVDKTDLSAWDSNWGNYYKAVVNNYIISISLEAPLYDEKRNKEVKKEIDSILSSIKINTDNFSKIVTSFSTNEPKIDIKNFSKTLSDTGRYRFYLKDNLYEYADIYLNELTEYNWKWKSAREIYNVQLKDVDVSLKSMIKFKWLDWFINCSWIYGINSYYNYYNYYNYYWEWNNYDENGNIINLESCDINILFPFNKELNRQNYLSISMKTLKNNKSKNLDSVIKFLEKNIEIYSDSNETNIPNILKNVTSLKFTDLAKQSTEYKNFLSLLARYNMIENTSKFNWDGAVKWWEFLDMYTKWVYNYYTTSKTCIKNDYSCIFKSYKLIINEKTTNLDEIFKDLWIDDYNDYVDSQKIENFEKILDYKLAWITLDNYSYENIALFEKNINEEKYAKEKKKLEDFYNRIYWNKKILIWDFYTNYDTYYFTQKTLSYYPNQNKLLLLDDKKITEKVSFSSKQTKLSKEEEELAKKYKCIEKKTYLEFYNCNKEYGSKYEEIQIKYKEISPEIIGLEKEYFIKPLTKANSLNLIFNQVDFWLFDKELAKKKDPQIEDINTLNVEEIK